ISEPSDVDTSCVEDIEGAWLDVQDPWSAVPPEVLQEWNVKEYSIMPEVTTEVMSETEATSDPSVTEAPMSLHLEHVTHASPLKITFDGLRKKQLLNPNKDYTVVVESFIGSVSQFLVVLSPYSNSSECSFGGFRPPHLDKENQAWTHTEDELPKQGNSSVEVGSCFFSVQGELGASEHVLLTYTPPECGCVTVRGYIAVLNGNHSEVAGPQEVPEVLNRLLCVDPHPEPMTDNAEYVEAEVELMVEDEDIEEGENAGLTNRHPGKAQRKADRKIRRKKWIKEMKETRGRAGWRQFKKQKRQRKQGQNAGRRQQGNTRPQTPNQGRINPGSAPWKIVKPQKPWKQQRKQWRHHKKHGKAGKWWKKGQHHSHSEDGESDQSVDGHDHHNGTDEIHDEELSLEEELEDENNELVEELLGGTETEEQTEEGVTEKHMTEENINENEVDTSGRKARKGHGKWKAKRRWHKKKDDQKQGVHFCCSQGIRTKKFLLRLDNSQNLTDSNDTMHIEECTYPDNVVTIFSGKNFGMNKDTCTEKFSKCCNNFTQKRWNQIIAKRQQKKQARKLKRQKAKHVRKQARKQHGRHQAGPGRHQERKQERKQQRQQNRRDNNARRQNLD
ncbi:unnamed protein product, partial [Meganyctiphanes norvegica]